MMSCCIRVKLRNLVVNNGCQAGEEAAVIAIGGLIGRARAAVGLDAARIGAEQASRRGEVRDQPAGNGGQHRRAHRRAVDAAGNLDRPAGDIGPHLRPEPAPGTAAQQQQRSRLDPHLREMIDHVAHGEAAALQHRADQMAAAMCGRQTIETAAGVGQPFRGHGAGQGGNEAHPIGARRHRRRPARPSPRSPRSGAARRAS